MKQKYIYCITLRMLQNPCSFVCDAIYSREQSKQSASSRVNTGIVLDAKHQAVNKTFHYKSVNKIF